ncbi:hypothetical protein EGT67_10150 [Prescottella agglutinans]|uniref:IPT/TIG domain-containing protein n=1 Tax=Prescottella agglutinans TaxID=1644129 RepID=A0A3S3APK8_9NOCA|nr:hypothetical protein [Prescottella agglutinans]RVW09803.1 hypothetical protein EGT67_10150 [Prescottella agglutinans]
MRTFTKSAVVAVAATIACTLPMGVAAAQTSPFGSLGSLGSSDPGTENPAPQVTVSKSTDIAADGESITVSGTGFDGAAAGAGLYVGVIQDDKWSATDASAWGAQTFVRPAQIVGGAWSTALDIRAIEGGADCLANTCSIYTVMAHGSTDRSQDTRTPITFAPPVVVPVGPAVTVSKTAGLTDGEDITVTGTGFGREGQGVYVGLAQIDKYAPTNSGAFHSTKWIKTAQIVDGGFTTTLTATAIKGDANCFENACAIYTLADHYSLGDRSQDTRTPVTFAPPVVAPSGPAVTASKTANIAAAGEDVTISGTGFDGAAAGTGLYVGIIQDDKWSPTDASAWGAQTFVRPTAIVGGAWSTTLNIKAIQGGADCVANTCSIYTVMAHGSTDRSQDTRTPITFAPVAANAVVDAPEIENVASVESDAGNGLPIAPLAVGGAIATGLALMALRRRA